MSALKFPELLKTILSQPAAPFREKHVSRAISTILQTHRVPYFQDPVGNIVVGVSSQKEYAKLVATKTPEPLRIFIAHMDHPGFHGVKWISETELEFRWYGGSPTQHLEGASVWIASSKEIFDRKEVKATTHAVEMTASGMAISHGVIRFNSALVSKKYPDPVQLYGGFDFREFIWQQGDLVYSKAADDLIGTYAITAMAVEYFKRKKKSAPPFIALLTRAEEVGFIGAIGHFHLGWLKKTKRPLLAVSLETSRTLPGADIGKGPVVRLGDRYTVFDAGALRVFTKLAEEVLPGAHQKRVMDGGSCEATAATVFGIPAIGISVPLGNYHNQSFEGGPDSRGHLGPAPEFVHEKDIVGLEILCEALLKPKLEWAAPWAARESEFKKQIKKYQPELKQGLKL